MPLDKKYWEQYVFELDQRISTLVALREKIRALLEVNDLIGEQAAEVAIIAIKQRILGSIAEVDNIDVIITSKSEASQELQ